MVRRKSHTDGKGDGGDADMDEQEGIWGTWEELVLACAVSRHGTAKWDSVAVEVGSRAATLPHLLTPQSCQRRYGELRQRYEGVTVGAAVGVDGEDDDVDDKDGSRGRAVTVPWLDDLRRLRVAELRREVERYDVSIVSLQLKVKKLSEERERSLNDGDSGAGEPDPDAIGDGESAAPRPETVASKDEDEEGWRRVDGDGKEPDPEAGGDEKGPGEGSCDGSSNTVVAKKGDRAATEAGLVVDAGASALDPAATVRGDSAVGVTGVNKESSDVQSSASPSRRKRGRRKPGTGVGAGAGAVSSSSPAVSSGIDEEVSRPRPPREGRGGEIGGSAGTTGSWPLASFLELVRSHKHGALFKRRLPVQETAAYRSLIRQHVDLDSINRRLADLSYSRAEFFRDLLLLCANATVFFPRDSNEHAAGVILRGVVAKELALDREQSSSQSTSLGQGTTNQAPVVVVAKKESVALDIPLVLEKPVSALVVCRKRSAISSGKAVAVKAEPRQKQLQDEVKEEEEKPEKGTDMPVLSGRIVEKPFNRGLRTTKGRGSTATRAHPGVPAVKDESPEPQAVKPEAPQIVEKEASSGSSPSTPAIAVVAAKKRSAAGFLKRLKGRARSPSPSPADKTPKTPPPLAAATKVSKGGGAVVPEQKKGTTYKAATKEMVEAAAAAAPSSAKLPQEPAIQPKRKGRPPKRKAAPPLPLPAKRARAGPDTVAPRMGRVRGGNRKRD